MRLKIISQMHNYIHRIYHSESIEQRIQLFQHVDLNQSQPQLYSVTIPSFLRQGTTKELLNFVSVKSIPNNIRILHVLTHIEYNAFMSYVDTLLRFGSQLTHYEKEFKTDMKRIALQQGSHYVLLRKRLLALGSDYGCLPVITKLTTAINDTQHSLIKRICVISLIHEGRGIKAVDKLIRQLQQIGDIESAQSVKIIQRDEKGHYQIGWKWLLRVCELKAICPESVIASINAQLKSNIIFIRPKSTISDIISN